MTAANQATRVKRGPGLGIAALTLGGVALIVALCTAGIAMIHLVLAAGVEVSGWLGLLPPLGELGVSEAFPTYPTLLEVCGGLGLVGGLLGMGAIITRRGFGLGLAGPCAHWSPSRSLGMR